MGFRARFGQDFRPTILLRLLTQHEVNECNGDVTTAMGKRMAPAYFGN
jgi:hypothetical protein